MDPEFQRVITRVLIVGGTIGAISTAALVVAFRAFAAKGSPDKDFRGTIMVLGVIGFVLVCCAVLMFISLR